MFSSQKFLPLLFFYGFGKRLFHKKDLKLKAFLGIIKTTDFSGGHTIEKRDY